MEEGEDRDLCIHTHTEEYSPFGIIYCTFFKKIHLFTVLGIPITFVKNRHLKYFKGKLLK